MYLLSSIPLLAVLAAPASSRSISNVVNTATRKATTIANHFGRRARLLTQETKPNRRMADSYLDFGFGSFQPELCPLLSLDILSLDVLSLEDTLSLDYYYDDDDWVDDEAGYAIENIMKSCKIGCDAAQENIEASCIFTNEEMCDPSGDFCVSEMNITTIVPFDFHEVSGGVCVIFTDVPANMDMDELKNKKSCISVDMDVDMSSVFDLALGGDIDSKDFGEIIEMTDCTFTLGDEICECNVCENGLGGDLICPNSGFVSEECVDLKDDDSVFPFTEAEIGRGSLRSRR